MNCTNCGAPIREGDKFCLSCGSPVAPAPPQAAPGPPRPYGPAPASAPMGERSPILIIPAIFAIIGGLMLLVGEFGGWYNYSAGVRTYGSIHAETIAIVLILPMTLLLFFSAYASLQAYRSNPPVARKLVLWGLIASMVVFIVVLIGGIVLMAETWDASSNWLSEGFYGGLFGGLISFIVLAYERKRLGQVLGDSMAPHRPPQYQPYGQPAQPPQPAPYQQPPQPAPAQPQPPAQLQCGNCRALLQPGVKFCHICGAPQS